MLKSKKHARNLEIMHIFTIFAPEAKNRRYKAKGIPFHLFLNPYTLNLKNAETMKKYILPTTAVIAVIALSIFFYYLFFIRFSWHLSDDGTLTLSGKEMPNYNDELCPWETERLKIKKVVIEEGLTNIGDHAFWGFTSLTSIKIPNSVTSIGKYAFCRCFALKSITIPNSVTSIGECAFKRCFALKSITIPNSVTSIGDWAFTECSSLTSITIPNSVTSIESHAFWHCSRLTSVTIPNSVTSIGDLAFQYCNSLTSITCKAETPPTLGEGCFEYERANSSGTLVKITKEGEEGFEYEIVPTTIYVPANSIDAYKKAEGWAKFKYMQGI